MVTLEDSPQGLSLRLGVSTDILASVVEVFTSTPELGACATGAELLAAQLPECCRVFKGSSDGAVIVLQVAVDVDKSGNNEGKVAFVCMRGIWTLWANCTKDNAQVLTECSHVQKYSAFDIAMASRE